MTFDEMLSAVDNKLPPAPADEIAAFEQKIGANLPPAYREFLVRCNGGVARRAGTPEGRATRATRATPTFSPSGCDDLVWR